MSETRKEVQKKREKKMTNGTIETNEGRESGERDGSRVDRDDDEEGEEESERGRRRRRQKWERRSVRCAAEGAVRKAKIT